MDKPHVMLHPHDAPMIGVVYFGQSQSVVHCKKCNSASQYSYARHYYSDTYDNDTG